MRTTVKLSFLHFFSIGAVALLAPFIGLFLRSEGLTATNIGVLLSIAALLELTITPVLTTFADRKGQHRRLYVWYILGAIIAILLLMTAQTYVLLALALFITQVTVGPSMSLMSQLTLTRLDEEGKDNFGNMRSLGSLGFGVLSAASSIFYVLGGYVLIFLTAIIMELSTLGFIGGLAEQTNANGKNLEKAPPRRLEFYILMVSMFFVTIGIRAGFAFLFIHFNENLGIPTERMGWIIAFLALVEVPFLLLMDSFVRRWGMWTTFFIGVFGNSLVYFLLGVAPTVGWLIPVLIFRAFVFSCYMIGTTIVVARISHPQNVATNQALIQVTVPGVAALVTGSLAGWLFDNVGAGGLYTMCCVVGIIGGAIMWFGRMYLHSTRYQSRQARLAH